MDRSILRRIVEQAGPGPEDVVLEVGAADGAFTLPLLERSGVVHAFEIDARYRTRLAALAASHPNLRVHEADALKVDLRSLDPAPTVLAANLAYNIAIPLIMTTIGALPSLRRWGVMVQRELGERLFAAPSTKPYSAVSVLTQLACAREKVLTVPAASFRPRPRVESCFVTFVRRPLVTPAEYAAAAPLVRLGFAHRRKVLTNTLGGAARAGVVLSRDDVRGALERLGLGHAARPEELTPPQWAELARLLGWLPLADETTEST